jgi:hypothetical protein
MIGGYTEPYKDPHDHTPDIEKACREHIEEHLQQEGVSGYIVGPAKFARKDGFPYVLGVAVLDPQEDVPNQLRFL